VTPWSDWALVLAVCRAGSLAGAAEALGVDATTVGRRVEALEVGCGLRLFERTARGVRLSPAAEALVPRLEALEAGFYQVEREVAGSAGGTPGDVRVTCSESMGVALVAPAAAAFHQRHPATRLRLITSTRSMALLRREADVALRMVAPKEPSLISRKAGQLAFGLYGSPALLKRVGPLAALDALRGLPVLGLEEELAGLPEARFLAKATASSASSFSTNSLLCLVEAVRTGLGLGVLPCLLGDGARGVARAWPTPLGQRPIWLVFPAELQRATAVREVVRFLSELIAANAARLQGRPV
jgi:DNA-binding transcriptional LysR family regulator